MINLLVKIEPDDRLTGLPAKDQAVIIAKAVAMCLTSLPPSYVKTWTVKLPPGCFMPAEQAAEQPE